MANITIEFLAIKPLKSGGYGYYWQPSAALKKAGWEKVNYGSAPTANDQARLDLAKARNAEVEQWKTGGAKPREIKAIVQRHTFGELIQRFKDECELRVKQDAIALRDRNPLAGRPMAPNTRDTYFSNLVPIMKWGTDPKRAGAGNIAVASISQANVLKLRDGLMQPDEDGAIHWHRAHSVLRTLRTMLGRAEAWGMIPKGSNPAADFQLQKPPARSEVWDVDGGTADIDAFVAAANHLCRGSVGLAVEIALWSAQRQADILKLTAGHWETISYPGNQPLEEALRGDDPDLRGFVIRQNKTRNSGGAALMIPIVAPLRHKVEAAIAANKARKVPAMTIIVSEITGRPWERTAFSKAVAKIRAIAVAPDDDARAKGLIARPSLEGLQFMDLRRTRVVRLAERNITSEGIATITGHSKKSVDKILDEVYRPRTSHQAGIVIMMAHGATPRKPIEQEQAG